MGVPVTKPDPGVDDESTSQQRKTAAGIGIALDLGVRLGVSVFLGLGAGLLLDSWLHTSPIFTLIGMVVGIAAAMYTIWDVARDAMRR
jgi:F0F1-type ATP synthase assembly protein I